MSETSELSERYTVPQKAVIASFFDKLAMTTNKTGKMSESRKTKIILSWEPYTPEVVISALEVYLSMYIPKAQRGKGKNENYVLGIIKNKAGEANAGKMVYRHGTEDREDEGARLGALIGGNRPNDDELNCDF